MTEVEICGGGHYTRLNNQLVCLWGAPSPVYKGVEEGEGRPSHGAPKGGVLLPVGVGLLMGRAIGGQPLPLLHSFIYGGGGTP